MPPTVRCIVRCGAGVNNIPVQKMTELGIPVFNTPGANANAVKELVVCGLLLASRGIVEGAEHVKNVIAVEEKVHAALCGAPPAHVPSPLSTCAHTASGASRCALSLRQPTRCACAAAQGDHDKIAKRIEKDKAKFVGHEIEGKTLGVVGLGAIGGRVVNAALALGMKVRAPHVCCPCLLGPGRQLALNRCAATTNGAVRRWLGSTQC